MATVENNTEEPKRSISFVEQLIEEDLAEGKNGGRIQTRFPPEPNGYLHIGHAKAICMDFGVAEHYNGVCNLRFDDTNPSKENNEYVENILQDISWLGFRWGNIYYASDYFERLWDFALWMIRNGHAYVDEQTAEQIAEQLIRPTGLLDPEIEVRPLKGQIDDLVGEIRLRAEKNQRVLVTTLTTRMAEDLTEYLGSNRIKVKYIHHHVETMERQEIIRDLRLGIFDVLVGVNLLREGLDIPEVSLVAVLDADKPGLLRSETALIQTVGRAARNAEGKVIFYGDSITAAMQTAIDETARRRKTQMAYNESHRIVPHTVTKSVRDLIELGGKPVTKGKKNTAGKKSEKLVVLSEKERQELIVQLKAEMKTAASLLEFERAAELRDRIRELENA